MFSFASQYVVQQEPIGVTRRLRFSMIRLLLALAIVFPSIPSSGAELWRGPLCSCSSGINTCTVSLMQKETLAPALGFMQHVLHASGYALRQWLTDDRWAWAAGYPTPSRVWEFEPSGLAHLHAPLRSDDAQELSSAANNPGTSLASIRAKVLLANIRSTPMVRGRLLDSMRRLRSKIQTALEEQGVPRRLAVRLALQLVVKVPPSALDDELVLQELGHLVTQEMRQLKDRLQLTDRQITVAVPKMSPDQVEDLFARLRAMDAKFGRTLAQAALEGADPLSTGQKYVHAFQESCTQLKQSDSRIARTLAAAAFKTRRPVAMSLRYLDRFRQLVEEFKGDQSLVRTIAKVAFSAANPLAAAEQFIHDHQSIVSELKEKGLEPEIARTIAGIAAKGAEPFEIAHKLLENFKAVVEFAEKTHPSVARSVALSACRATDPLTLAATYLDNYDTIVRFVAKTDPRLAHEVAGQAFRSHDPLAWAQRFLQELKTKRRRRISRSISIVFILALLAGDSGAWRPGLVATAA